MISSMIPGNGTTRIQIRHDLQLAMHGMNSWTALAVRAGCDGAKFQLYLHWQCEQGCWLVLSRFFRKWKSLVPPTLEWDDELEELEPCDELNHLTFIANEFRDELESDDDEPDELEPESQLCGATERLTACIAMLRELPGDDDEPVSDEHVFELLRALKDYLKHCRAHGLYVFA